MAVETEKRNRFKHVGIDGVLELQNRLAYAEADNARFVAALNRVRREDVSQPAQEGPSSFERQLARVKAGASITEVRPFNRRADPEFSLIGGSSRWMAS